MAVIGRKSLKAMTKSIKPNLLSDYDKPTWYAKKLTSGNKYLSKRL